MTHSELPQPGWSSSIPEINAVNRQAARDLARAFRHFGVTAMQAVRAFREFSLCLRFHSATALHGCAWLRAHPGRRLPGSLRNRRLAKKRVQYLERWAREVGLP